MTDGYIYISYILNDVNRVELTKIMLALEDGSFINHEKVHYIKTKNFRLEIENGMIVIDGELTHFKNINCNIHPKNISLIC